MESFSARVSWAGNSDNKLELDWELRSTHTHETRGVACLGRDNSAARTPDEGFPPSPAVWVGLGMGKSHKELGEPIFCSTRLEPYRNCFVHGN